jgi:type I restriction enzyme S subunit
MTWRHCKLGDIVTLKRGHDLPERSRQNGDVPVVSSSGVTGYHKEAKASPPGVVTGRYGTLGEVYYIEQDYWPLNTALYVVDFKGNNPRFVAYFLKNALRGYRSDKAAVPGIDRNVLHELIVNAPGQNEQVAIVTILSVYDDLIANNTRRIELLERSARLLFEEWFARFRYPGHEHDKVVGGIPEGWSWRKLGDIATTNDESFSIKAFPDEITYIDIASVKEGRIFAKTRLTREEAPGRARRRARHGDVIWSNVRPNLRQFALILYPEEVDVFSTGFTILTAISVPFSFLYVATTTAGFVAHLVNHTTGSSYPAVRPEDFEKAMICVPPNSLLTAFHSYCEPLFQLSYELGQSNEILARARDLLLPRLMDGRIRLSPGSKRTRNHRGGLTCCSGLSIRPRNSGRQ